MLTQHVNHFPRMSELCRKDLLARNLNRMRRAFPADYAYFPRTWVLPAECEDIAASTSRVTACSFGDFMEQSKPGRVYICKPENSCQGQGIRLVRGTKALRNR